MNLLTFSDIQQTNPIPEIYEAEPIAVEKVMSKFKKMKSPTVIKRHGVPIHGSYKNKESDGVCNESNFIPVRRSPRNKATTQVIPEVTRNCNGKSIDQEGNDEEFVAPNINVCRKGKRKLDMEVLYIEIG